MRSVAIWFFLSCKRYVHKISFLAILLLLPMVTIFVRGLEQKEGTEIRIAVWPEVSGQNAVTSLEWTLAQDLANRGAAEGMFRFYLCDSEEQLKEEVASRQAECGYVIGADLRKKLDANDYKRCIRVYSAPSTVTAKLSAEVVFSMLMARYDKELFQNYVENGEALLPLSGEESTQALRAESGALYDAWMENGGTFRFEYETVGETTDADNGAGTSVSGSHTPSLFPVRGIVAVYIFVAGLYSAAVSLSDERKGLFLALPAASRIPCQLAAMTGPVALAALSGKRRQHGAPGTGACGYGSLYRGDGSIFLDSTHGLPAGGSSLLSDPLLPDRKPAVLPGDCGCGAVCSGDGRGGENVSALVLSWDVLRGLH